MKKSLVRFLGAALIGLSAMVASSTASAAIVTGNWDPKLPQNFGNYGWTATINVVVDPDCQVGTPAAPAQALTIVNFLGLSFGCSGLRPESAFRIVSAEVGIYDWSTKIIQEVLTFNPRNFGERLVGELQLGPNGDILSLRAPFPSNALLSTIDYSDGKDYDFRLALPGGDPALEYRMAGASGNFTRAEEPVTDRQFTVTPFTPGQTAAQRQAQIDQVIASTALKTQTLVFSVPEPSTLALAGFALAAVVLSASRRRRQLDGSPATTAA